jgi:hypothetical protein
MQDDQHPSTTRRVWLHWGLIVAGLYLALFVAITLPVLVAGFFKEFAKNGFNNIPFDVYKEKGYWVLTGVLVVSQFLFLRVPIRLGFKRPTTQKSIWLPIIVSGFWLACLVIGALATLIELFKIDPEHFPWWVIIFGVVSWIAWAVVFLKISRSVHPGTAINRQTSWLLRGSILELLIAVPSHIVARGRSECCAGFLTFFGITMGLSVMLLSFGPAVFLLYHARWQRLKQPDQPPAA